MLIGDFNKKNLKGGSHRWCLCYTPIYYNYYNNNRLTTFWVQLKKSADNNPRRIYIIIILCIPLRVKTLCRAITTTIVTFNKRSSCLSFITKPCSHFHKALYCRPVGRITLVFGTICASCAAHTMETKSNSCVIYDIVKDFPDSCYILKGFAYVLRKLPFLGFLLCFCNNLSRTKATITRRFKTITGHCKSGKKFCERM